MTLLGDLLSNFWIALAAKLLFVALFIPVIGIVLTFSEIKLSAKMQHRVGPYFAGGRWGWAQPIADGIKFFQKEDLVPAESDQTVFKLGAGVCGYRIASRRDPIRAKPRHQRPVSRSLLRISDLHDYHPWSSCSRLVLR